MVETAEYEFFRFNLKVPLGTAGVEAFNCALYILEIQILQ